MVMERKRIQKATPSGAEAAAVGRSKAPVRRGSVKATEPLLSKRAAPKVARVAVPLRIETASNGLKSTKTARVPDTENWDQRLGFLIHDVSRLRRTVFDSYVRFLGVTRSQWWVLVHLSRHDGMIQTDLAKILDLGKAPLGALLDRLEASELIQRRPDEIDRRAKRVYLSAKGVSLIAQMRGPSHEMSERVLNGMSPEKRNMLVELLTQVRRNLDAIKVEEGLDDSDAAEAGTSGNDR